MSDQPDTYRMLKAPVEQLIVKERKSKFIGYAYPVYSEDEIKALLDKLKKQYSDANHICYAWKLGSINPIYRVQDDGEPRNSAGIPIYGQINSFELTNVVVFVVRYFGGTKLGVGGLISAYRSTARNVLESGAIEERSISCRFQLQFDYSQMNTVQRVINKLQLNIEARVMEAEACFVLDVPLNKRTSFLDAINRIHKVSLEELTSN